MELAGLFLWSFLAATVLPLGSEPALVAIVMKSGVMVVPVIVASIGNFLGACTTYLLARVSLGAIEEDRMSPRAARARDIVQRYGAPALLLSWVPLVGDAIVAAAGAARMKPGAFAVWTLIGKVARYVVVAWIALAV